MPFVPHTETEVREMLQAIGVNSIDDLFDEIPAELRSGKLEQIPKGLSEMEVTRLMSQRAEQDGRPLCFVGAGAYEHHIPAAVWEVATRGEYYTAYTPYQAEASQGTLQLLYEYQTMMAGLNGMDVSNASLYDGASALAEAVLMAVRANRKCKSKRVLIPRTVHPNYRATVRTLVGSQGLELEEIDYDHSGGFVDPASLPAEPGEFAALVIPQPNFFGVLEEVDALTDWARRHGGLVIAVVNPLSLALLKPPGEWGSDGVDIACGEGQPLGIPLSSGGPYYGFLCAKQEHVRQMPGRIIGRTVDADGKPGFALTLQAREQHIRRSKATSNICTNQGLMVTASTIFMALVGSAGLEKMAAASHTKTRVLVERMCALDGISPVFDRPTFHETVLRFDTPLPEILRSLNVRNILGGYPLGDHYPELENCLLVCATETKSEQDIDTYTDLLGQVLDKHRAFQSPVQPKM